MDAHVFNAIVESDPEVLLGETKIAGNTAEKAKIIRRLLNVFESGKMSKSVWDYRQRFSQLKTPELVQILTPYLSGPSRNDEAVIAAIEISRACELSELGTLLAAIALDPTFHIRVRTHAAATIEDIGDLGARRLLRPLALSGQMEDLQDDLKGYGLLSCWPDHMTADELFCSLTQPKNENYISSYRRFLGGFSKSLRPDDMLSALRWVEREQEKNNQTALGRLSDTILERAVQFFDQADVRSAFASILMKSAAINPSLELRRSVTSCTLETRQALTRQLLRSREVGGAGWLKIVTICSLASTDVPWLLTELQHAQAGLAKHVCANIIGRLLDGHDVESYSAALLLANEDPDLATAIRHLVSPVDWNGPDAEQARHFYLLSKEDRESPEVEPAVSSSDHIESTLASNSPEAFFRIDSWLHRNKKRDPQHPIPGWEELDHDLRSKVIASARECLETRPPVPAGNWWRQGIYTNGLLAGYNALHLLACESPYLLDQIDETGWAFWIKVALSYAPGSMDDCRAIILDRGYRLAQAEFLSTMSDSLDGESERHKRILLLNQMGDLWDEKIASILRAKLESDSFAVGAFVDVLNKLLKMKDTHARILARKIATRSVPESQEGRLKAVLTTGALLSEYPEEWTIMWPILQSNVSFGIDVLQHAAPFPPSLGFTANLRENEIGDLCLWLSRLGLDRTDESGSEL